MYEREEPVLSTTTVYPPVLAPPLPYRRLSYGYVPTAAANLPESAATWPLAASSSISAPSTPTQAGFLARYPQDRVWPPGGVLWIPARTHAGRVLPNAPTQPCTQTSRREKGLLAQIY